MKTILLIIAGLACAILVALTAGSVMADGGPHGGYLPTADGCAGCHRAHTAAAGRLLVTNESTLCLSCHGTGGTGAATNVQDGVYGAGVEGTAGHGLKAGGFVNALMDTNADGAASSVATTSAHTYDAAAGTLWGSGAAGSGAGGNLSLTCTNCHDPHGTGTYRILRKRPIGGDGVADVVVPDDPALGKSYTVSDKPILWRTYVVNPSAANYYYSRAGVDYDTADAVGGPYKVQAIALSAWCAQCHDRYQAPTGSWGTNVLNDPIFSFRHTTTHTPSATGSVRACVSCHVAHGTTATMGTNSGNVAWPGGGAGPTGNARSSLLRLDDRGVCNSCHGLGAPP